MNTQKEKKCPICEKVFKPIAIHHKFCSDICRKRNFRNKKKTNFDKFTDSVFDIEDCSYSIIVELDKVIYRMSQHDDLNDELGYKNAVDFLYKLKNAFQKLDGQSIDNQ